MITGLRKKVDNLIAGRPWPLRRVHTYISLGQVPWDVVRDLLLGRLPREYAVALVKKHGFSRRTIRMSLFTCSPCQLHCEECIMQHSMPLEAGFMEGVGEIKKSQADNVCRNRISNDKVRTKVIRIANEADHRRCIPTPQS